MLQSTTDKGISARKFRPVNSVNPYLAGRVPVATKRNTFKQKDANFTPLLPDFRKWQGGFRPIIQWLAEDKEMPKPFLLFAVIIILTCSPQAFGKSESSITQEKDITLKPGSFPYVQNAQLGTPKTFYNEMDGSHTCYPLILAGRQTDWINRAVKTKSLLLFNKCEKYKEDISSVPGAPLNAIHGWVRWTSYTLTRSKGKPILTKLDIPNYNDLSFDKYCDTLVAYWALVDKVWWAYVYDVQRKQLIFKQEIESSRGDSLNTDYQGALGEPQWNHNCTVVEFPKNYYVKIPIKAEIKR